MWCSETDLDIDAILHLSPVVVKTEADEVQVISLVHGHNEDLVDVLVLEDFFKHGLDLMTRHESGWFGDGAQTTRASRILLLQFTTKALDDVDELLVDAIVRVDDRLHFLLHCALLRAFSS